MYRGERYKYCAPVRGVREDEFPAPRRGHGGDLCPCMGRLEERHRGLGWSESREKGRRLGVDLALIESRAFLKHFFLSPCQTRGF